MANVTTIRFPSGPYRDVVLRLWRVRWDEGCQIRGRFVGTVRCRCGDGFEHIVSVRGVFGEGRSDRGKAQAQRRLVEAAWRSDRAAAAALVGELVEESLEATPSLSCPGLLALCA